MSRPCISHIRAHDPTECRATPAGSFPAFSDADILGHVYMYHFNNDTNTKMATGESGNSRRSPHVSECLRANTVHGRPRGTRPSALRFGLLYFGTPAVVAMNSTLPTFLQQNFSDASMQQQNNVAFPCAQQAHGYTAYKTCVLRPPHSRLNCNACFSAPDSDRSLDRLLLTVIVTEAG